MLSESIKSPVKAVPVVTHKTQGRWAGEVEHGFPEGEGSFRSP